MKLPSPSSLLPPPSSLCPQWPHLIREISLELTDTLQPVASRLLTDQLDVEEGALAWPIRVARRGPPHDARRHVSDDVLEAEEREGREGEGGGGRGEGGGREGEGGGGRGREGEVSRCRPDCEEEESPG